RTAQYRLLAVSAVLLQPLPIVDELFQCDVSLVVPLQTDAPIGHRNRLHSFSNLAIEVDLTAILVTAENVDPRIGRILQYTQHAAVAQPAPDYLAIPCPAVGSLGKS